MKWQGPRSARYFLDTANALRAPREQACRLLALQHAICNIDLAAGAQCKVSHLKNDVLFLFADTGVTAAKLKQSAPSLLARLHRAGHVPEVARIEVRVRPRHDAAPLPKRAVLNGEGLSHLERYAANLDDMPLKAALRVLIERQRRRR
ncbi:MAG: DciA family protein [Burkholderiales bacterium]|nr:DUF721 domain-containing protein [Burkholderiales bacterium]MDQ3194992.1 DUF721 domain-containing protein [Pseudomonadota bacterium]